MHASQTAAGIVITLLSIGAIVWFVGTIISQIINAKN